MTLAIVLLVAAQAASCPNSTQTVPYIGPALGPDNEQSEHGHPTCTHWSRVPRPFPRPTSTIELM